MLTNAGDAGGDVCKREWIFEVQGLGKIELHWTDVEDRGRQWLKDTDEKFMEDLRELEERNRRELRVLSDIGENGKFNEEDIVVRSSQPEICEWEMTSTEGEEHEDVYVFSM